jgi:hypothetical protein
LESLTVMVVKLLRRHPVGVPYVLVCTSVVTLLGWHPW